MIESEDLLELARRGASRPRQVSLRLAVSTAYYAMFHALARECANSLVGESEEWEIYEPLYRSLDHGACTQLFKKQDVRVHFGETVAEIGACFISLQQHRHDADYDPGTYLLQREQAVNIVDQSRQTIHMIKSLPKKTKRLLAVHLLTKKIGFRKSRPTK